MKDLPVTILTAIPVFVLISCFTAFLFAVVMQPIFVWVICARLKATNASLRRLEKLMDRQQHNALPNPVQRNR